MLLFESKSEAKQKDEVQLPLLIKFYESNYKTNIDARPLYSRTCYDGARQFTFPPDEKKRYYPDEHLIAKILKKFIYAFTQAMPKTDTDTGNKKIVVLTEPWSASGRNGGSNTEAINKIVIDEIEKKSAATLYLVPFLYGYHHPGVVIDQAQKNVVYIDPYGVDPHYAEVKALRSQLQRNAFSFYSVQDKQQQHGDTSSCGPILTQTMLELAQNFLAGQDISQPHFTAPRPNLATNRMLQMYINNIYSYPEEKNDGLNFNEIMLAAPNLWAEFLHEHNLPEDLRGPILKEITANKYYIERLRPDTINSEVSAINNIKFWQAKVTELIILGEIKQLQEFVQSKSTIDFAKVKFNLLELAAQDISVRNKLFNPIQFGNLDAKGVSVHLDDLEVKRVASVAPAPQPKVSGGFWNWCKAHKWSLLLSLVSVTGLVVLGVFGRPIVEAILTITAATEAAGMWLLLGCSAILLMAALWLSIKALLSSEPVIELPNATPSALPEQFLGVVDAANAKKLQMQEQSVGQSNTVSLVDPPSGTSLNS